MMPARPAVSRFAAPPAKRTAAGELPADTNMAGSASWAGRGALHAGASRRLLTRLAGDTDPELRRVSASSVVCPPVLLERLAGDDQAGHAATLNPAMRPAALRRLAVHSRWVVRAGVAENPACSPDLVDSLTEDSSEVVRQAAAANPNISEGVLQRIVYSHKNGYYEDDADNAEDDLEAWRGVASNPACPAALMWDHAEKSDAGTLLCLASNPAASDELLERLTGDCCPEDYYYAMQEAAASNPAASPGLLRLIVAVNDTHHGPLIAALSHSAAPLDLIEEAAVSDDSVRRCGAASNLSASEDLLSKLADDSERSVLCAVAQNRSTPDDVLRRLAETPYRDVRVAVACNPVCGPAVVEQLAKDSADMVREVAASHPSCPATALKRLRDDSHFPTAAANARRALTLRCL